MGPVLLPQNPECHCQYLPAAAEHDQEECNLRRSWQKQASAITPDAVRNSDQQFLKLFSESQMLRQDDETYCAGFPWKAEHPTSADNFSMCQKCTQSLVHQLGHSPGLLQIYNSILQEQLKRGFIELVADPSKGGAAQSHQDHLQL